MLGPEACESSAVVRARVAQARNTQERRFRRGRLNAAMTPREVARHCEIGTEARAVLERAMDRLGLSARGFHRVLKVARTIADLAGAARIEPAHLEEAIQFRAEGRYETIAS
jgi:magnesium chelatase family protein